MREGVRRRQKEMGWRWWLGWAAATVARLCERERERERKKIGFCCEGVSEVLREC